MMDTKGIEQLASIVAAGLAVRGRASRPVARPPRAIVPAWRMVFTMPDATSERVIVGLERDAIDWLASKLDDPKGIAINISIARALGEIGAEVATLGDGSPSQQVVRVEAIEPCDRPREQQAAVVLELDAGNDRLLTIGGWVESLAAADEPNAKNAAASTLGVLLDIDLPLVVRFGETRLPIQVITALGPGSVIDLGRLPDDPVDLLVNERVVARGEVVVASGQYAVRITEVTSPETRLLSLGE
jgi:flagellar motor switch protein FliN/FliY